MWSIGSVIKELREDRGLTQKQFGEMFGITGKTVSNYELGEREPSLELVTKMADFFGVSVDYLLNGRENIETKKGTVKIKFKSGHSSVLKSEQLQELIRLLESNKIDAESLIEELNNKSRE